MGRKKLEIKRIEKKSSRQVTFTKRRNGLMKKAEQLGVLCDVEVAVIVFSDRGKLYHFAGPNTSLSETIQRFTSYAETEVDTSNSACGLEKDHPKFGAIMSVRELLEKVESHLEDPDHLSKQDFIYLWEQLEAALLETRTRKTCLMMASIMNLEEKEKKLRGANRLLEEEIASNRAKINEENLKLNSLQNSTPHMHTFL